MAVRVEKVQGIIIQLVWTCDKCAAERRLRVTMGEPKEVACPNCGHVDTVILDRRDGREVK